MNTNKNKLFILVVYVCAVVFTVVSFVVWTTVIAKSQSQYASDELAIFPFNNSKLTAAVLPISAPNISVEKQTVHETDKAISVQSEQDQQETQHGSAREKENPSQQIDDLQDELLQWELSARYELSIPTIGVRTSVYVPSRRYWDTQQWELLEEQMQVGLSYGAVVYPHSVQPGRRGNILVAGHSSPPDNRAKANGYGSLLSRAPELEVGDEIIVNTSTVALHYRIDSIEIVSADETAILLQQSERSQLKLITCYPVGTTRERFVATATLVSDTMASND